MRLFPRLEDIGYSHSFVQTWEAQRRICTEKHFDTYFRMGIGDDTLHIEEINEFIDHANSVDYVKQSLFKSLSSIRKNGKSKVPLLLNEINIHASQIDKSKFQPIISAIFEIADDIYREDDRDRGFYSTGDTYLRIHWLIRKLTFNRCDLNERSNIFLTACRKAPIGWLADFTWSALREHFPPEGKEPQPPEKCLITKDHLEELKTHCINTIRSAATTEKLLSHPKLLSILFSWSALSEDDGSEIRAWTNNQIEDDKAVSTFARAFTGESWSHNLGMFGLGDRVSMPKVRASVESMELIIDADKFRRRLEELESGDQLDEESKNRVTIFLKAWRSQEKGDDRFNASDN